MAKRLAMAARYLSRVYGTRHMLFANLAVDTLQRKTSMEIKRCLFEHSKQTRLSGARSVSFFQRDCPLLGFLKWSPEQLATLHCMSVIGPKQESTVRQVPEHQAGPAQLGRQAQPVYGQDLVEAFEKASTDARGLPSQTSVAAAVQLGSGISFAVSTANPGTDNIDFAALIANLAARAAPAVTAPFWTPGMPATATCPRHRRSSSLAALRSRRSGRSVRSKRPRLAKPLPCGA